MLFDFAPSVRELNLERMKLLTVRTKAHKFYFVKLDCLVRVESRGNTVVIRASRDNFSERQKVFFVRHLAVEGFIPDDFQRYSEGRSRPELRLHWCVDQSWVHTDCALREKTRRQVLCTIAV